MLLLLSIQKPDNTSLLHFLLPKFLNINSTIKVLWHIKIHESLEPNPWSLTASPFAALQDESSVIPFFPSPAYRCPFPPDPAGLLWVWMSNYTSGLGFNRSHPTFSMSHRPEWIIHHHPRPWHRFKAPFIILSVQSPFSTSLLLIYILFLVSFMSMTSPLNCSSLRVGPYLLKYFYRSPTWRDDPPWQPTLCFGPELDEYLQWVTGEAVTVVLSAIVFI